MNILLRAKKREGEITVAGDDVTVGPLSFKIIPADRARFLIQFNQRAFAVGVCSKKMTMCIPAQELICIGELIHIAFGSINSSISVRYNDFSFLVGLVNYATTHTGATARDVEIIRSMAYAGVRAKSVKYSTRTIDPEEGWMFIDATEMDRVSLQALDVIGGLLGDPKFSIVSEIIMEKLTSMDKRGADLSTPARDKLKELLVKFS